MKSKELAEFKNRSKEELQQKVADFRERLHGLKMDLAAGKVKNVREINNIKKNIAQALTIIKSQ